MEIQQLLLLISIIIAVIYGIGIAFFGNIKNIFEKRKGDYYWDRQKLDFLLSISSECSQHWNTSEEEFINGIKRSFIRSHLASVNYWGDFDQKTREQILDFIKQTKLLEFYRFTPQQQRLEEKMTAISEGSEIREEDSIFGLLGPSVLWAVGLLGIVKLAIIRDDWKEKKKNLAHYIINGDPILFLDPKNINRDLEFQAKIWLISNTPVFLLSLVFYFDQIINSNNLSKFTLQALLIYSLVMIIVNIIAIIVLIFIEERKSKKHDRLNPSILVLKSIYWVSIFLPVLTLITIVPMFFFYPIDQLSSLDSVSTKITILFAIVMIPGFLFAMTEDHDVIRKRSIFNLFSNPKAVNIQSIFDFLLISAAAILFAWLMTSIVVFSLYHFYISPGLGVVDPSLLESELFIFWLLYLFVTNGLWLFFVIRIEKRKYAEITTDFWADISLILSNRKHKTTEGIIGSLYLMDKYMNSKSEIFPKRTFSFIKVFSILQLILVTSTSLF